MAATRISCRAVSPTAWLAIFLATVGAWSLSQVASGQVASGQVVAAEETAASASRALVGPSLNAVMAGEAPKGVGDLKALQTRLRTLSARVTACTVNVSVGPRSGSGVIISADGLVLTAAHVIEEPDRNALVVLPNGRRAVAKTLGVNRTFDAGLVKILQTNRDTEDGSWPHAEMGDSRKLEKGQWCLATGHPNGFQIDRLPVVRLGRILDLDEKQGITTDCTLVGGDSGGPLFDLDGRVVGIHSRIGGSLSLNIHVPVAAYVASWERLQSGEAWGHLPGTEPYLGVQGDAQAADARVTEVFPNTAAAKAGLRKDDVILRFAGQEVSDFASLSAKVAASSPGEKVVVEWRRGDQILRAELVIGKRGQ